MSRRLSIAMLLSVAIHLAAFAILEKLLGDEAVPTLTSTVLLVSIQPHETAGDVVDDSRVFPAVENDNTATVNSQRVSGISAKPSAVDTATDVVIASEVRWRNLKPAAETRDSGSRAPVALTDYVDHAVAASIATQIEIAAPAIVTAISSPGSVVGEASNTERALIPQAGLTREQARMLDRKVRNWTQYLHTMPDLDSGLTWTHEGQEYQATFTRLPAADDMGIARVIVEISTVEDGKRLSSEVRLKRLAFSNYAQFVNRWDPDVLIHNDETDGRFHSNTEISLAYDRTVKPLFHGMVTTASHQVNVAHRRGPRLRDQIFLGGLQTGVRSIRLPKRYLPFPGGKEIADERVHRFREDTRITFNADGSYVRQSVGSPSPRQVATISEDTTYLIADSKVTIRVRGTVNGKVLVYSPERIVIEDDLVYAENPEDAPDADDYLGLVSDKYVDIAPPDITGPGDLVINAAIYAKRRFAVRRYRVRENALLYVYGSLSAGSLSATEPRYYTRIRFDQRYEELRPPGFPMTDRYEVESRNTAWMVEPIG